MKRSAVKVLKAPPNSPSNEFSELKEESHGLNKWKQIFIQEIGKIEKYQGRLRKFCKLLKENTEYPESLQQENNSKATVLENNDHQVLQLGDEPSSSLPEAEAEAHDQDQELIIANGISKSLKLDDHKSETLQFGNHEPFPSANGLIDGNQKQGLLYVVHEPSSARVEADDQYEGLMCTEEGLESLKVDQDQGLQSGNEASLAAKLEIDQIEGPSSPIKAKRDQGLESGNEPSLAAKLETDQIEEPSSSIRAKRDQDDQELQSGNERSSVAKLGADKIEGPSPSIRVVKPDQDQELQSGDVPSSSAKLEADQIEGPLSSSSIRDVKPDDQNQDQGLVRYVKVAMNNHQT
ncbi:hypothetical protein ACH5RR_027489 [Cinchona calisaya]|uniref:Uncharacterized protein n=1 Tax=Cinchona calisaya TaxID=153742 RepID=A0ABD2Z9H8_9GENT